MADFAALATRYVLADGEEEQRKLANEAAEGIKGAPRKSAAVLIWAQSINSWMPGGSASGAGDDLDGDVISRAKALGFLAATLQTLDKDVLRVEQVEHLISFFGAMFAIDHKAGILAAADALRYLCAMSHFRPFMAESVLRHLAKLGDDFRLQATPTRQALYDLVARLVDDPAVSSTLQKTAYGDASCGFLVDLLQLCRNERDPDNLVRWFGILRSIMETYGGKDSDADGHNAMALAPDVAEDVFRAVSDYFPISMRSSATPAGITVDDLKTSLRACFAACASTSRSVFDFLLQKLDQGDVLTVSVKVDILSTIHACIEAFPRPAETLVPHTSRIWNALKYEVRHGDVPEAIDWTLRVIEALSRRLCDCASAEPIQDFSGRVLADCINDLSNPTYTRQAGQLLTSLLRGGLRAYHLGISPILTAVKQNIQQAKTATHTRDLLAFLGDVLRTRQAVADSKSAAYERLKNTSFGNGDRELFFSHDPVILGLLDGVYLSLWNDAKARENPIIPAQVMNGLAELVGQRGPTEEHHGNTAGPLLCSSEQCLLIFSTLAPHIQYALSWETAPLPDHFQELAHEATLTLKKATAAYPPGFAYLVQRVTASIRMAAGGPGTVTPSPADLTGLLDMLSRLAYIGSSAVPTETNGSLNSKEGRGLDHFSTLTEALYATLEELLQRRSSFALSTTVLSGIYGSLLHARDVLGVGVMPIKKGKDSATAESTMQSTFFSTYLTAATAMIRKLYVRATTLVADGSLELSSDFDLEPGPSTTDATMSPNHLILKTQDQYLHQLSSMATFVIRDLAEDQQVQEKLYEAPFRLFHNDCTAPSSTLSIFHVFQDGRIDVLSLGILRGLHPAVVARLVDSTAASVPSPVLNMLDDWDTLERLPPSIQLVRNGIITVLANKFSASVQARAGMADVWKKTLEAVQGRLDDPLPLMPSQFARIVAIAAGAFARMDRDAKSLAPLLALTPTRHVASSSSPPFAAEKMAHILGQLVAPAAADCLAPENHAVVKSVYRQWVYGQTVKELLPLAFPKQAMGSDGADHSSSLAPLSAPSSSIVSTIAIVALVRHMPYSVYEDDVDNGLVRILVVAVTNLPSWTDVTLALRVLYTILDQRPQALQGHLKTLIDASMDVFGSGSSAGSSSSSRRHRPPPPGCRKQALRLVTRFPAQFEEGLLLPYGPRMSRALAAACGDRVREIREVAQLARASWSKIDL